MMWALLVLLAAVLFFASVRVMEAIDRWRENYAREIDAPRERTQAALMSARLRTGNGTVRG